MSWDFQFSSVTMPHCCFLWGVFQKYKELEKSVRVEEIDGVKLVKNLAVKMEEMFRKKAEATRVRWTSGWKKMCSLFSHFVSGVRDCVQMIRVWGRASENGGEFYIMFFIFNKGSLFLFWGSCGWGGRAGSSTNQKVGGLIPKIQNPKMPFSVFVMYDR